MSRRSALSLAIVIAFGLVAAAATAWVRQEFFYGGSIRYGEGRVFYTAGVTEAEARRAGDVLDRAGFWGDRTKARHVQLSRRGDTYVFRAVARTQPPDPAATAGFRDAGGLLSAGVFGGAPVVCEWCDGRFQPVATVP